MLGRKSFFALISALALPALVLLAAPQGQRPAIRPTVPTADRSAGNRVFLEHADILKKNESDSFMVLVGDVMWN